LKTYPLSADPINSQRRCETRTKSLKCRCEKEYWDERQHSPKFKLSHRTKLMAAKLIVWQQFPHFESIYSCKKKKQYDVKQSSPVLVFSLWFDTQKLIFSGEGNIYYIIFIFNCYWVDTRWQQYSTHLHTNTRWQQYSTHLHTNITQNTENGTYIKYRKRNIHKIHRKEHT
jgi:hypothetical protein